MKNLEITNPVTYYSPYGYIQVDENEYSDTEKTMISFTKNNHQMTGSIKVNYNKFYIRKISLQITLQSNVKHFTAEEGHLHSMSIYTKRYQTL